MSAPEDYELLPDAPVLDLIAGPNLRVVALEAAAHWLLPSPAPLDVENADITDITEGLGVSVLLRVADLFLAWLEGPDEDVVAAVIEDAPQLDPARQRAYWLIDAERERQERIHPGRTCASPAVDDLTRFAVLAEEVGEVATAFLPGGPEPGGLRRELVQVAAVAVAWLEHLTGGDS